ncbi:hypothetical protein LptCag_0131 [Leptospirillum ferriphilum]|uniref:Uncharacterized protein n=1 Tax=Leptospirillum ferriphilum TaxID=178606 RepID=A0A094W7S6_9BACT|nr:hypothetical protein LptCag_0131 [Leptospirillum ferriphilum]
MPPSPALSTPVHAMADGTVCPVNFLSRIQPPGSDTMCRDQGRQKKNDPTKPDRQRPFSGHPAPLIYFQCAFTPAFIIYLFPELSLVIPFLLKIHELSPLFHPEDCDVLVTRPRTTSLSPGRQKKKGIFLMTGALCSAKIVRCWSILKRSFSVARIDWLPEHPSVCF